MNNLEQNNWEQYGAITLDNSIVMKEGRKFNMGKLAILSQFNNITKSVIDFIIVDIIFKEMEKHLLKIEEKVIDGLVQSCCKVNEYFQINEDDNDKLGEIKENLEKQRNKSLNSFIDLCGITIINSSNFSDVQSLVEMYFSNKAPFAETGNKKNEFPDAIALLSLENWAKSNQKKILAISKDGDWKKFAETSDWIDVYDDLNQLIHFLEFQREKKETEKKIVNKLKMILHDIEYTESTQSDFVKKVKSEMIEAIENKMESTDISIMTSYNYEIDDVQSEVSSIDSLNFLALLNNHTNSYQILFTCIADIELNIHVNFYIWERVDKEYINLGSKVINEKITEEFTFVANLYGNILSDDKMDFNIIDVECTDNLFVEIDMGDYSPFDEFRDY